MRVVAREIRKRFEINLIFGSYLIEVAHSLSLLVLILTNEYQRVLL